MDIQQALQHFNDTIDRIWQGVTPEQEEQLSAEALADKNAQFEQALETLRAQVEGATQP